MCFSLILIAQCINAVTVDVVPGVDSLEMAIAGAAVGDTLQLQNGDYFGPVIVDRTLNIIGSGKSIVDGGGKGRVITIAAADSIVKNMLH